MFKKFAVLAATLAAAVTLVVGTGTASAAPTTALGGGSGILILKGGDKAAACTLTTIGHDYRNRLIGLTAGHCGTAGQSVVGENFQRNGVVGKVTYSTPDLDFAIIEFDAAKVAPLRSVGGVTIRSIQTAPPRFPDIGCKTGRTTGNTCGVTLFSDGTAHFSTICIAEGDSGSPVVLGNRLVGMINAFYYVACIGPETGTNIGPILTRMNTATDNHNYRVF
ncbi:chymotrypsin family serine protease [Williamsia sterculiae]|uniref:Peptidase S1 family protein n=1 Tax=Williamsia sterculiae TaxID=1344003 RepID=A0A1N7G4A2_9NOCA|nr:trypsin-like peptidase domain-containing protein [Williamsia sterculiae]SIS07433.1 hypothetical protein SAMN05445060_2484 [Williamsia sterculiae]